MTDQLKSIIKDLVQNGDMEKAGIWQATELFKDLDMLVLRKQRLEIKIPKHVIELSAITKPDLPWAEEHFQERVAGIPTNPGETYKYWPYHTNLDKSEFKTERFSHTYQERFWPKQAGSGPFPPIGIWYELGDLNDLIEHLNKNNLTRQAYLPIWFPEDTGAMSKQRVPCSLGYYFWIKEGKLNCIYTIRSCDAFRHFRNDVYLAGRLLQYIAIQTNTQCGELTMDIYNFHIFVNDLYPLKKKETKLENEK